MTPREREEYRALRATIRERGTARHWMFIAGLAIWSALTVAVAAVVSLPVATLLPLLVLAATFEAMFAMHTGVERVGRYLQVFYETTVGSEDPTLRSTARPDEAAWEHTAMAYGRAFGGSGIDALFSPIFGVATLFNFIPVVITGPPAVDWALVGVVHLLFIARIVVARGQSGRQRAVDLERFEQLKKQQT